MNKVKISSFKELTIELVRKANGDSSVSIKEERQLDIETTSSTFGNIMPCSFPNPEQMLMNLEESLGSQWDNNINISGSRQDFIDRCVKKAYS